MYRESKGGKRYGPYRPTRGTKLQVKDHDGWLDKRKQGEDVHTKRTGV
jgi:hypothetical protein